MQTGLWYAITLGVSAWCIAPVNAMAVPFSVNPGLWDVTFNREAHGAMPLPPEILQNLQQLPPERRAAMERAMASQNNVSRTMNYKRCVTQKQLDEGASDLMKSNSKMKCEHTLSTQTSTRVDGNIHCTGEGLDMQAEFTYQARDRKHVAGTMNATMTSGTNTMTEKGTVSGQWISASCGDTR
jgi:hypothetical protein